MNLILDIEVAMHSVDVSLWHTTVVEPKPVYVMGWAGTDQAHMLELITGTVLLDPDATINIRACACGCCTLEREA
jgi:hypothetical protein